MGVVAVNTTPCRVSADLRAYTMSQRDATAEWERAEDQAWREFAAGDLDDRIDDLAADESYDAVRIALFHCFPHMRHEPRCSVKDYAATVSGVIEDRAKQIYQELIG